MTVSEEAAVRASLKSVLTEVGVTADLGADQYLIDLAGLDKTSIDARTQRILQTLASLIFRIAASKSVIAILPSREDSQRELAASGMLFALAQSHARLTYGDSDGDPAGQTELLADPVARALGSYAAWRSDYSPASVELRNFLLGAIGAGTDIYAPPPRATRLLNHARLGIVDRDFAAFVNPHRIQNAEALSAVGQVATPWLRRVLASDLRDGEQSVTKTVEVLGHALENVAEHAFDGLQRARSLITIGRSTRDGRRVLRLQVLDNGVGLPASIAAQRGEPSASLDLALDYVHRAVEGKLHDGEPLLPGARGRGIPEMRKIAVALQGQLDITTSGPDGTQILVECSGGGDPLPYADRIPVVGTIVSLWVPLSETATDRSASVSAASEQTQQVTEPADVADLLPFGR